MENKNVRHSNKMSFPKVGIGNLQRLSLAQAHRNSRCVEDPRTLRAATSSGMTTHLNESPSSVPTGHLPPHGEADNFNAPSTSRERVAGGRVRGKIARGFTLIELLVVVLIIGILAAVALPQYQVAVQKAKLMKYVPIVRALNEAEQVYFLANGEYTADLQELDVEIPTQGCTYYYTPASSGYYQCGTEGYGVWGKVSNAQAGDDKIRYLQFFADYDQYNMKAGDVACYSNGEVARKACRSLGPGSEQPSKSSSWEYVYTLNR